MPGWNSTWNDEWNDVAPDAAFAPGRVVLTVAPRDPYFDGQAVLVSLAFTTVTGAAVDPTTVVLRRLRGDGDIDDLEDSELTHDGEGLFSCAVLLAEADELATGSQSVWLFEAIGTGDCTARIVHRIVVRAGIPAPV